MILADTCIWVDHLREGDADLARLLQAGGIVSHPFVVGELAMGSLKARATVLGLLMALPQVMLATDEEVLTFVDTHKLFSLGLGYIDAHLLAATMLSSGVRLWTRDVRLDRAAESLGICCL